MTNPTTPNNTPEPTPPSALSTPRAARTRRHWHQDPLVRTWLFPPVIGAGLGMLLILGLFWLPVVLGLLIEHKFNLPDFRGLANALYTGFVVGAYLGVAVSVLWQLQQHLHQYPNGILVKVLKGTWQVLVVLCKGMVVLMSVLIPALAVGAVVAQTTNKRR